jgi:hypothetical protein
LRNPLPVIAIPLRSTDPDVALQLQPLVDRCYRMGGHDTDRHDFQLIPPFDADDEAWVRDRLKRAGIPG